MKPSINLSKKQKEWAWFAGIWSASLLAALSLGYAIKFLLSLM